MNEKHYFIHAALQQLIGYLLHWRFLIHYIFKIFTDDVCGHRHIHSLCSASQQEIECQILIKVITFQSFLAHLFREPHLHEFLDFILDCDFLGKILSPALRRIFKEFFITFILLGHLCILGIVYDTSQTLPYAKQRYLVLESRGVLTER